ncbi:MAG: hypothetical protein KJ048_13105 [Dehalococcoidia bacterium]|nr:hypothetical protein [Dehalococcoidia bacterium]
MSSDPAFKTVPPASAEPDSNPDGTRETSTIGFPYDDLEAAIEVATGVHRRGGRCAPDELAAELNYSGVNNGAFRLRVATARVFNVISTARGNIELSPLGQRIVDPHQVGAARADAFLAVPLYRAVYERFRGATLPPANGLERVFAELGVSVKQTDKARQAFQRSAQQAGYFNSGTDRLVAPVVRRGEGETEPEEKGGGRDRGNGGGSGGGGGDDGWQMPPAFSESLIRGLIEKLPTPGSDWAEEKRTQWLALASSIFAMVYNEPLKQLTAPQPRNGNSALVDVGQSQ